MTLPKLIEEVPYDENAISDLYRLFQKNEYKRLSSMTDEDYGLCKLIRNKELHNKEFAYKLKHKGRK